MPKLQRRNRHIKIIVATLFLLVIAAVACTSGSDNSESEPTAQIEPPRAVVGDYETCLGFLDAQHIEEIVGDNGLFARERVIRVEGIPGLAESGAVSNCLVEVFRTVEMNDVPTPGESLALSIVKFQTRESASLLFDSTLASAILSAGQIGDAASVQREVIGVDSYLLDIKVGGLGAIVVYISDTAFVSMSSTADSDGKALLNGAQLLTAAEGVQSRLPQFAQTRFTDR